MKAKIKTKTKPKNGSKTIAPETKQWNHFSNVKIATTSAADRVTIL